MARRSLSAARFATSSGISAAGTTQGTATALVSDITQVSTVGSGQGVILPSSEPGKIFRVVNKGANALLVYPPTSSQINALATNAGFSLAVDAAQEFFCATTAIWYTLVSAGGGGTTTNALTMNNSGSGAASGTTFNGSAAQTISYNTIGAPSTTGTGATGTWPISISGAAAFAPWSGISGTPTTIAGYGITNGLVTNASQDLSIGVSKATIVNNNSVIASLPNAVHGWEARGNGTGAAVMTFHRPSAYAAHFGLDTDNKWKVGGWSMGAVSYELLNSKNNTSLQDDTRNTRGVTRLYRSNDDSDFSVQTTWDGARWLLQGYNGDTYHAEARVAYADRAVLVNDGYANVSIGYRDIPTTAQNGAYTFALIDAGRARGKDNGTAYTYTIPANASVAFPIGTTLTVFNNNATSNITIAITTDTLRLAGTTTTGSRTLAPFGVATFYKVSATVWLASGPGLT